MIKEFGLMQGNSLTYYKGKQNTMYSEDTANINKRNNGKVNPDKIHILPFSRRSKHNTSVISSYQRRVGIEGLGKKWKQQRIRMHAIFRLPLHCTALLQEQLPMCRRLELSSPTDDFLFSLNSMGCSTFCQSEERKGGGVTKQQQIHGFYSPAG